MTEIRKYYCIKELYMDTIENKNLIKGEIYDIQYSKNFFYSFFEQTTNMWFTELDIACYFITLNKYRELKINKILNNE